MMRNELLCQLFFLVVYCAVCTNRSHEINSLSQTSEQLLNTQKSKKPSFDKRDNIYIKSQNKNSLDLRNSRKLFNNNKFSFAFQNNLNSSELFLGPMSKRTDKKNRSRAYETCNTNNVSPNFYFKMQHNKKRSVNISEYENFNASSALSSTPVNQPYEKSSIQVTEGTTINKEKFLTHSVSTTEGKTNFPFSNHTSSYSSLLSNVIEKESKTNANKRSYVPWEKQSYEQTPHITGAVNDNSHFMQDSDPQDNGAANAEEHTTEVENIEVITEQHTETIVEHGDNESETTIISEQQNSGTDHKNECEKLHGRKCICLFNAVVKDLENIVSKKPETKVNIVEVTNYVCTSYGPLPESFSLSPNVKPKILHKNEKILVADEEKGPKEIDEKSLDELMQFNTEDEGINFFVFANTNVDIPCFPSYNIHLSTSSMDAIKYFWTRHSKVSITEGRITPDTYHGTLRIEDVNLKDADNYTCDVSYVNPDTGRWSKEEFIHTVIVVALPKIALHTVIHYKANVRCEDSLLEMFELYLPQQIEQTICGIDDNSTVCNVEIRNPVCQNGFPRQERHITQSWIRFKREDEDAMEMSLNYEVNIRKLSLRLPEITNYTHCNPNCHQKLNIKLLQIARDSIKEALLVQVTSSLGATFEPLQNTLGTKFIVGCIGGFELSEGFCVPCKEGHYSDDGATVCSPCPYGTYQGDVGSRSCIRCPHPWLPGCAQLYEHHNFAIFIVVLLIFFVIIVIFVNCYLYSVHKDNFKGLPTSEKAKVAKTLRHQKESLRQKYRRSNGGIEETEPLVDEEDTYDENDDNVNEKYKPEPPVIDFSE